MITASAKPAAIGVIPASTSRISLLPAQSLSPGTAAFKPFRRVPAGESDLGRRIYKEATNGHPRQDHWSHEAGGRRPQGRSEPAPPGSSGGAQGRGQGRARPRAGEGRRQGRRGREPRTQDQLAVSAAGGGAGTPRPLFFSHGRGQLQGHRAGRLPDGATG